MIVPEKAVLRASQWCYRGIWSVVTSHMQVPEQPPHLSGADDQRVNSFRPASGFLRYLKFQFWVALTLFDGVLFVGWLVLLFKAPWWLSLVLTPIIWAIMILPDIVAYIAIHLRYDTTWYVLSDRSMRIRRGIWTIHETTITYDNIQNVSIRQGPLQRYFGIANVLVETAGGGSSGSSESTSSIGHSGLLEGIDNAPELRELLMAKWQESRSSGLGDEVEPPSGRSVPPRIGFDPRQVELLQEIRDLSVALAKQ